MFKKLRDPARYMKQGEELKAALAPDDAVVVDAPADFAVSAIEAAQAGHDEPARDVLAWTRENHAADDRSHVASKLGELSGRSPQWQEWEAAEPDNPDLAVVKGWAMVTQAWEQRSHLRAKNVSPEQFQAFHASLAAATEQIQRAVDLNPDDAEPWNLALVHARGLEAPREVFDDQVASLREVDPFNYWANTQALQYLCNKWFGSTEEMYDFAAEVARKAPPGSRAQTLLLDAVFEHFADDPKEAAKSPYLGEAVDRTKAFLEANADAGHHVTAQSRNLLAFVLFHTQRFDEAYEQLVAIGPHATDTPWGYYGDARATFLEYRGHIVTKKATG